SWCAPAARSWRPQKERMHTLAEGYHPSLDGAEKCSRRLTATSETNMTPEYRSKIGFKPARIGSTFSCGTTVISITRLSISLNIGWAVCKPLCPFPELLWLI